MRLNFLRHFRQYRAAWILGTLTVLMVYWVTSSQSKDDIIVSEEGMDLLVLILSAPANIMRRQLIRETWLAGDSNKNKWRGFFTIGVEGLGYKERREIVEEKEKYNDIMILPIRDGYKTLTYKVLKMFEFADTHFTFKHLLKCDDDSFVIIPRLQALLASNPNDNLYLGFFDGRAPVMHKGKWADSGYTLCDRYIPYALGGGYVLGASLVSYISRSAGVLQLFNNEDVSVGTWLAGVRVQRVHDPRFDTEWTSRGCSNNLIVSHNLSPEIIRDYSDRLKRGLPLCVKEFTVRPSYSYNWKVPPSKCCTRE